MFDQNRKSCVQPKKVYQLYFRSSCDCTVCIVNVALCIVNCECVCSIWESAKKCNRMCKVLVKTGIRRGSRRSAVVAVPSVLGGQICAIFWCGICAIFYCGICATCCCGICAICCCGICADVQNVVVHYRQKCTIICCAISSDMCKRNNYGSVEI